MTPAWRQKIFLPYKTYRLIIPNDRFGFNLSSAKSYLLRQPKIQLFTFQVRVFHRDRNRVAEAVRMPASPTY